MENSASALPKKLTQLQVELLKLSPVYFFLALINLRVKLFMTPAWNNGNLLQNHQKLLAFNYTNNEQSRLLQFYIPEFFHKFLFIDIAHAYILQRWLFVFLAFLFFHYFLRKWFDSAAAFAGVAFLAAIMPLTYFNHLQESAPLLMFSFVVTLWAIREKKNIFYMIIMAIAAINNETILFIPAVFLFYHFDADKLKNNLKLFAKTIIYAIPAYLIVGIIRYINIDRPHLGKPWTWADNLFGLYAGFFLSPLDYFRNFYWYLFFIFGAFWVYAYLNRAAKPLFIRRALLTIPLFILPHILTGVLFEVRQMIPMAYIIIPAAMFYLFAPETEAGSQKP